MGFTIGNINGKSQLVAVCDWCGDVSKASRNEKNMNCIVPKNWERKSKKSIGTQFFFPVYHSNLKCPDCLRKENHAPQT